MKRLVEYQLRRTTADMIHKLTWVHVLLNSRQITAFSEENVDSESRELCLHLEILHDGLHAIGGVYEKI
jgi:hypothetical protein